MDARWTYKPVPVSLGAGAGREGSDWVGFTRGLAEEKELVWSAMLEAWGGDPVDGRFSQSLQETAYGACKAALSTFTRIASISMQTPNVHFYCYPL